MKRIYLLLLFASSALSGYSQALFSYGNTSVDKEEFLRAYNKNKIDVPDKEKALREYLDLYIRFKLKVKAALELKLDTLPQLQYDLQSFRSQIEDSYLNNEKAVNDLLKEAFIRSQKDLHIIHYFIPVDNNSNPEDSLKVFKAIHDFFKKLNTTNVDALKEAAALNIKQSDFGFITSFTIPYEFETLIYGLKPGQYNKPYRSKSGWHIFQNKEERRAVGKWKIAQILIALPPEDQIPDVNAYAKKADSIYYALKSGADFATMAKEVSDDKITFQNGGEMPEFGTGKFEQGFENEVFKLTKDGEIGKPFLSPYGFHIIKRISHSPVPFDSEDLAYKFDLKQKLQQDARINIAKDLYLKDILKQIGFKKTIQVSDADLFKYADSAFKNQLNNTSDVTIYPISQKVLFTYGKTKAIGSDWLNFIRDYKNNTDIYRNENYSDLYEIFTSSSITNYYKKHLENYNADFKYQIEEFKEGNVLFEIMEKNVWGKAATDTVNLLKHFADNKQNYLWGASANIILFNCTNKLFAEDFKSSLKNGKDWRLIVEDGGNNLQADSGRFDLTQIPIAIDTKAPTGTITEIIVSPADGMASFAKIIKHYAAGIQRNFDEARGLVINDYQNILEEQWIESLKKKFPVKVNEVVFQSLLK